MLAAKRPRVLVADDYPPILVSTARLLTAECDVVGVVSDGEELVDAMPRLRPDVVVLDLNLPNVNSLEFCRTVGERHPRTRVIVITGMVDDPIMDDAREAGATAVISKYALGEELLAAVKAACGDW